MRCRGGNLFRRGEVVDWLGGVVVYKGCRCLRGVWPGVWFGVEIRSVWYCLDWTMYPRGKSISSAVNLQ